jgi:hypothetical protein
MGTPLIVNVELPAVRWIENPLAPWPAAAAVGSGKFETPWERMHCAIVTSALSDPLPLLGLLADDPHATRTSEHVAAAAATCRRGRRLRLGPRAGFGCASM